MDKIKTAILGATGMIGQSYLYVLENHPWFEITSITGGESAGKKYADAGKWSMSCDMPKKFRDIVVQPTEPKNIDADIIFSALPASVAKSVEPKFVNEGYPVISDSSAFRTFEDVPVVIPEVNPDHLDLINVQKSNRGWDGYLVSNPNCTTLGLMVALKPLYDTLSFKKIIITTMQALSGAGFPGVPALSITDNILPYIEDEEEKAQFETRKILGRFKKDKIELSDLNVEISCNRVPTLDGHLETVYVETNERIEIDSIKDCLKSFRGLPQRLKLPTAPDQPIIVRDENDRPQPRFDRMAGSIPGMSVSVGRIRRGLDPNSFWMTVLSHNTIRGGSGSSILIGELLAHQKML